MRKDGGDGKEPGGESKTVPEDDVTVWPVFPVGLSQALLFPGWGLCILVSPSKALQIVLISLEDK